MFRVGVSFSYVSRYLVLVCWICILIFCGVNVSYGYQ